VLLARLTSFFRWCAAKEQKLIAPAADPAAGISKPVEERPRDRALGDDEIRSFWKATAALDAKRRDAPGFGAIFRLLLLTAQRRGEGRRDAVERAARLRDGAHLDDPAGAGEERQAARRSSQRHRRRGAQDAPARRIAEKGTTLSLGDLAVRAVKVEVWREAMEQSGRFGEGANFRNAWMRAQGKLGDDGHIGFDGRWVWATRQQEEMPF